MRVVAGAFCEQWLRAEGVHISAYLSQVGAVHYDDSHLYEAIHLTEGDKVLLQRRYEDVVPCPDKATAERMAAAVAEHAIAATASEGSSPAVSMASPQA